MQKCVQKMVGCHKYANHEFIREYGKGDDITKLDFRDIDGLDPLSVDDFFKTKALLYRDSDLCSIFVVLYENELVGCFTLSMNGIHRKYFSDNELVSKASTSTYPCVLLGNMGIDKQFRNKGLGQKK